MKPFWKKWWFWALLVVVVLSLPLAVRYSKTDAPEPPLPSEKAGDATEDSSRPEPTREPTEEPTETPTEAPAETPTEAPMEEPTETPTEAPTDEPTEAPTQEPTRDPTSGPEAVVTYILNTNTKKFHYPDCSSVSDMKEKNKQEYTGSRDDLIAEGYSPCGRCKP